MDLVLYIYIRFNTQLPHHHSPATQPPKHATRHLPRIKPIHPHKNEHLHHSKSPPRDGETLLIHSPFCAQPSHCLATTTCNVSPPQPSSLSSSRRHRLRRRPLSFSDHTQSFIRPRTHCPTYIRYTGGSAGDDLRLTEIVRRRILPKCTPAFKRWEGASRPRSPCAFFTWWRTPRWLCWASGAPTTVYGPRWKPFLTN